MSVKQKLTRSESQELWGHLSKEPSITGDSQAKGTSWISFLTLWNAVPMSNLLSIIRDQNEAEAGKQASKLEQSPNVKEKLKKSES